MKNLFVRTRNFVSVRKRKYAPISLFRKNIAHSEIYDRETS